MKLADNPKICVQRMAGTLIACLVIFQTSILIAECDFFVSRPVARINSGSGFFVQGGSERNNLVFFVTAEHVVSGVGISTLTYLREVQSDNEGACGNHYVYGTQFIEQWYFHPEDYRQTYSTEAPKSYDVAVAILGTIDNFEKNYIHTALPISALTDFRKTGDEDEVEMMGLQFRERRSSHDKLRWKDKSLKSYKGYGYNKTIQEVTEIIIPETISKGDSGSLIYYDPEPDSFQRSLSKKEKRGYSEKYFFSSCKIYGLVSGVKVNEKEYNEMKKTFETNLGVFVIPARRIKETIDFACGSWKQNNLITPIRHFEPWINTEDAESGKSNNHWIPPIAGMRK